MSLKSKILKRQQSFCFLFMIHIYSENNVSIFSFASNLIRSIRACSQVCSSRQAVLFPDLV